MQTVEAFKPAFDERAVLHGLLNDYPQPAALAQIMKLTAKIERVSRPALFDEVTRIASLHRRLAQNGYPISAPDRHRRRVAVMQAGMMLGLAAVHNSISHRWTLDAWNRQAEDQAGAATDLKDMEKFNATKLAESHGPLLSPHVNDRLYRVMSKSTRYTYYGEFRRCAMYTIHTAGEFVNQSNTDLFVEHMELVGFPKAEADEWVANLRSIDD